MLNEDKVIREKFKEILKSSTQIQYADPKTALELTTEALSIARSKLGKEDIVFALNSQACCCKNLSKYEDSILHAQEALSLVDETEGGYQYAKSMQTIGMSKAMQGNNADALDCYLKSLNELKNLDDAIAIGALLNCIGGLNYDMGIFDKALDYFIQSEKFFSSSSAEIYCTAGIAVNIANVLRETGRYSEAMEHYKQSIEIFRKFNQLDSQHLCLFNLAICTLELSMIEETRDIALECSRIGELLGDEGANARTLQLEGDARNALGDPYGALWSYKCSLEKLKDIGDSRRILSLLINHASVETDLGHLGKAEKYLNEARKLAESQGLNKILSDIHFKLAEVHEKQNRFIEALSCYKTAYETEKEVLGEKQHNRISSLNVIHEVEKSRQEAEINHLKNVELAKYKDDLEKLVSERTAELRRQIQERQKTEIEKAEIESQLIRSQRLSDLARLTGGITHDFNNLLTVVMAYSELAQSEEDPQTRHEDLDKVIEAGHLGADLASQLLSFCRMQPRALSSFDLSDTIRSTFKLLDRLMVGDVSVVLDVKPDVGTIFGDKTMISQVIINLCINAGDAMPDGGVVNINAFTVPREDESSGDLVQIEVSDQGTGMPPEVVEKIFNPYFTTKGPGKGTGLGLSVVYGIIEQHKGRIEVESEVGRGTTFRIFLPLSEMEIDFVETSELDPKGLEGTGEHILLVEDQEEILNMLIEVFRNSGYIVSAASNVEEATRLYNSESDDFDLAFIDLFLPDGSGTELAEAILEKNPDQRILFGSGYARKPEDIEFIEKNRYKLIRKPYSISELKKEIRKALNRDK